MNPAVEVCKGVILKTAPYAENRKILRVYSAERGYFSLISPPALFRRKHTPALLMQVAEIEYAGNGTSSLHRLYRISPMASLPDLYGNVLKMNIVLLWGEVLDLMLRNEGRNESLFAFIVRSAECLNALSSSIGNFNLFFLYRLAGLVGFRIDAAAWREGYLFHLRDGTFYPQEQAGGCISGPNTARAIHRLCVCEAGELADMPLDRHSRSILLDIILLFYSVHLDTDFNTKSIQVIREVFLQ